MSGPLWFLPGMTQKNAESKRHCKPTGSKTICVQHVVGKKNEKHEKKMSQLYHRWLQMIEAVMTQNNGQGPWTPKNGEL